MGTSSGVVVAYLVNQYPKVSHSFIRREILALERRGLRVLRFAVRGWNEPLVDPDDRSERDVTRYLMQRGLSALVAPMFRRLVAHPRRFATALVAALHRAKRADRSLPYHLVYLAQACALLEWLHAERATHLHAHFGTNPAEVAMLIRLLGGPPYSFTVHGPEEFDKPEFLGLREKVRHAAFVVAVSSYGRSQLFRWVGIESWSKVHVVHCGLDAAFHAAGPAPLPLIPRLICVGRLCEQKGQTLLIEAAHRLKLRQIPFELVLAGDGEMRAENEQAIARFGLQGSVRITGWISSVDVRSEILNSRAMVLASFAEGLPVALMEAMALGRPVLTTFVAGIPELVVDREHGWLVPAGDVAALAVALETCLTTSVDVLATMGRAARTRVLARHNVDVEANKLALLFAQASAVAA
jgi:glycosyltransferase involved in cell wall biosynthesis